jgi:CRP-like cAMP-binding protein
MSTNDEEKTVRFAKEKDFTTCSKSFLNNEPSTEYLQAIEDTKVIIFETAKLKKYTLENIRLMRFWNDALSKTLNDAVERVEFFVSLTPQERYEELLRKAPDLIHRVPQKYLASYIGVTTVSLSRIRSRLVNK